MGASTNDFEVLFKGKIIFQAMLMSDLHLEYGDTVVPEFQVIAPILLLAGDIGRPDIASLKEFLLAQCQRFEHIFYVAGNHCFYDGEYNDRLKQLQELDHLNPRIHFLQNKTYLLPNRVRILGTILWTHISEENAARLGGIWNDYRSISLSDKDGERLITVEDTNRWHAEAFAWLQEEIEKARDNHEYVIIITHHAPVRHGTCWQHDEEDGYIDTLTNDHAEDCTDPIRLWVHGHTHFSSDLMVNSTKIVSNQLGLFGEMCGFRPNMKVTMDENGTVSVTDSV